MTYRFLTMLHTFLIVPVFFLASYAEAEQIALVAERDGCVHGPFETTREHRLSLDAGLYRMVPIHDCGNALAVRMQTIFMESISVTNMNISSVLELLSKKMNEKMGNFPGFVIDESRFGENPEKLSEGITMNLSMISFYNAVEYLAEISGLVATYNTKANTVELLPRR